MTPPLLEARSVSAGFGRHPVVRDIGLTVAHGESLALVGPNASGKSTLLRALAGALASGEVLLQGTPLARLTPRERARRLALVPQSARWNLGRQVLVLERVRAHVAAGGGALVVLHDLALAARMERVAVLDAGVLVAVGPAPEVLTPARLARTWGIDGVLEPHPDGPSLVLRGRAR